jgi:hypothetical protein
MTTEAAVKMVENFIPEETKMVRDAYREFLKNFDCGKCPTIRQTTPFVEPERLLGFVIEKQGGEEPCYLCHGFPILLPGFDTGCPCLVMSKDLAYKRLVELVESWDE